MNPRQRLCDDRRGATIVEFAIVAPVMCLMLVGAFDIGHTLYMRAQLEGIVQKTARDATLETFGTDAQRLALDRRMEDQVKVLANNARVDATRRFYRSFDAASIKRQEDFTDSNRNGRCDAGEPYIDANNNQVWDADGGNSVGGAKDAAIYTVTVRYPRFFPLHRFIGGSAETEVSATTVLRNQPFGDQGSDGTATRRNCP